MFSGLTPQGPNNAGKRIYGLPSRRQPEFAIGWDSGNQLNEFQIRKSKNKEVTGKITTQSIIQPQVYEQPQRQQRQQPQQRQPPQQQRQPPQQQQRQPPQQQYPYDLKQKDYESLFYDNPNMSNEELQKMMAQYEEYKGTPSRNYQGQKMSEHSTVPAEMQERRGPIRPRQSMKDIIYSGVGVGDEVYRGGSRRNSSNFKAQSYDYYPVRKN